MLQVTGLKFYDFFRTGHRSPEPYTNTSNKSQNRQKMAPESIFFASAPPACEAAPRHSHEVLVLAGGEVNQSEKGSESFSGPVPVTPAVSSACLEDTAMSATRKLQSQLF
jgi:hypothetical protein